MNSSRIIKIFTLITAFIFSSLPAFSQNNIQVVIHTIPPKSGIFTSVSPSREMTGDYYVSIEKFAEIIGAPVYKDEAANAVLFTIEDQQITLFADNPFFKIGSVIVQMPLEVKEYRYELYIPLGEFIKIIDSRLPGDFRFDKDAGRLDIYFGVEINLPEMIIEEKANGSLIHIKTLKLFGKDLHYWFDESKYHLTVEFYGGKLDTIAMSSTTTKGLVLGYSALQYQDLATIIFRLSRYTEHYEVTENQQNGEVIISLTKKGSGQPPVLPENLIPEKKDALRELVEREKEAWAIKTVVLDPGHGGKDPGTISAAGLKEKDIVLDIALEVGKLLSASGIVDSVIYTRKSDVFVPLRERAKIANDGGKLFVSIHVNSNTNPNVRGFETYFLTPAKTQEAIEVMEVVQRENDVMNLYENKDPNRELTEEDKILLSMTQNAFIKESEQLATHISRSIEQKTSWQNRGVKQAGFLVLWGVSMPNVLVETGFLTNNAQQSDLRSAVMRRRIAEGIFDGIKKFIEEARR